MVESAGAAYAASSSFNVAAAAARRRCSNARACMAQKIIAVSVSASTRERYQRLPLIRRKRLSKGSVEAFVVGEALRPERCDDLMKADRARAVELAGRARRFLPFGEREIRMPRV